MYVKVWNDDNTPRTLFSLTKSVMCRKALIVRPSRYAQSNSPYVGSIKNFRFSISVFQSTPQFQYTNSICSVYLGRRCTKTTLFLVWPITHSVFVRKLIMSQTLVSVIVYSEVCYDFAILFKFVILFSCSVHRKLHQCSFKPCAIVCLLIQCSD